MSIRIKADLSPYGAAGDAETIAILDICNRAATGNICDYDYRFGWTGHVSGKVTMGPWYILRAHDRRENIWSLVGAVLARRDQGKEEKSDYVGD
jgi:hypothetical protein